MVKYHSKETRQKIRLGHLGKQLSIETKKKQSKTRKRLIKEGKIIPYWKGKKLSKEHKQKLIESHKGMLGKHLSKEHKRKISLANKGISKPKTKLRNLINNPMKNTKIAKKHGDFMRMIWKNKDYREKTIKAHLKGLFKRPTSLERKFLDLIKKYNLPYKYVGDGSFLIDYKNPDFINVNGEKICIEVANRFHHQGNWKQKRIEHFIKYGWKCIVIFEDELENEQEILDKIKGDLNG